MITKFRIEGKGEHKEALDDEISARAQAVMESSQQGDLAEDWECTQDVITGRPGNYIGRQVYVYRGN